MSKSNFILDLRKVVWARFLYVNQEGSTRNWTADFGRTAQTVYGEFLEEPQGYALPLDPRYPSESRLERARRLGIVDTWTPRLEMRTFSRELLVFEGDRAMDMYVAYKAIVFGRRRKQEQASWKD